MPSSISRDEHAVTVREELITGFDRMTISGECFFSPSKRADQHEQGGLRQVKIGQQRVDHFQAGAGGEEDVGCAGMWLQPADAGTVLQRADGRGAGSDDATAFEQCLLDLQGRFLGQRISFGVEVDLCDLRHPHWLERPQPDMERQVGDDHASGTDSFKDFRGEVQPGGGRGYRAALLRKDGLVALTVQRLVVTTNVGGQRDMPQKLQPGEEIVDRREAK